MSYATIGFARLPKHLRELLAEDAGTATAAAAALEALARETPARSASDIVALEQTGDRIAHELRRTLPTARVGSEERGDVLSTVEAIDDILDAIESAAHDLPGARAAIPRERLVRATAIVKDLVWTTMETVPRIEDAATSREALHERAHALEDELRIELRAIQAIVAETDDVLAVVRAADLLRRLRSIGQACARALLAIEVLAAAHV
jgi:uncharacterized protein Yka (UPF0111/DUF47 family)